MPLTDEQKRGIIEENRQIIAQLQERASFIGPREKAKPSFGDVFRSPDPFKTGLEALGIPGGLQKEAVAAKGFVTFPYDLMKDIVLPTYKGTAKALYTIPTKGFGAAQEVVEEEVKPHQRQAVEMAKAFGGGVLDWLKMSLLPDTPAGIVAKQRIGDRIKEHGYLAEAVHPAVLLGLVRGGVKAVEGKTTVPRTRLRERIEAVKEEYMPHPRKVIQDRLKGIEEMPGETPGLIRPEMQPILDQILQIPKKAGPEPLQIPKKTSPTAALPDFVLGKEGRLMRTTKKRRVGVPETGREFRPEPKPKKIVPGKKELALKKKLKAEGVGEAAPKNVKAIRTELAKRRSSLETLEKYGRKTELQQKTIKRLRQDVTDYETMLKGYEERGLAKPTPAPAGKGKEVTPETKPPTQKMQWLQRDLDMAKTAGELGKAIENVRYEGYEVVHHKGKPYIISPKKLRTPQPKEIKIPERVEIKRGLLAEIEKAKERAPEYLKRDEYGNEIPSVVDASQEVTFKANGATFTVKNTKEALTAFEKQIKRKFPVTHLTKKGPPKPSPGKAAPPPSGQAGKAVKEEPFTFEAAARAKTEAEMPEMMARVRKAEKGVKPPTRPMAKDAWKLTLDQYIAKYARKGQDPGAQRAFFGLNHRKIVRKALSEGKPVPKSVLAEYPELGKKGKLPSDAELLRDLPKELLASPKLSALKRDVILRKQQKWLQERRRELGLTKKRATVRYLDTELPEHKITGKAKLDLAEQKALDRIKKRGTRLTAGIDPAEMADLAIIGAAKIAKGTIKFGEWSAEMVKEYGARVKPYLKRIYARSQQGATRLKANAELDSFIDYFEDIQAPKGLRPPRKPARAAIRERLREEGLTGKELTTATNAEFIVEVNRYGIALRKTKGGKITPAIREAGTYVPEDFATYGKFKDAKAGIFGGTKDATRFIQEIDGALSVEAKAKLPGQGGPAERYVLHRTRDMVKSKLIWTNAMKSRLATITKGASKKQLQTANQVIEHISRGGAYVDPAKLLTNRKISALTKDIKVVRLAQEGRKLYESLLRHQNELRRLRGQTEIPHRDYYTAHSIHETTIWERALGHNKTPKQTIGPGLPDYIKPNAAFNARAMAREIGLPETVREMNLQTLLERYIETAGKDIYSTSIIQNNKAFIQQLESMGYKHAARGLENWTAEAFGGVKSAVDRAANLSPTIHKGMSRFRQGLLRSVFPLNFAWNTFVQTSSGVLTYARYGNRSSIRGLYDWFGNKKMRQEIRDNAYSAIIKSQRSGRISRQDINRGVGAAQRLSRGKLEKVSDAANFFTEWVERHLTGWSVATAKRHGAAKGLRGKALWEYASDGGAKTQSMYNLEDLPGMLRSELIKTGGPFQTFSFEVFNTLRETAGKTGCPPATNAVRIKMALRFLAGVTTVNYIGQTAIGRKPWELSSFIPFYGAFFAPISAALRGEDVSMTSTRGLPAAVGIAIKGGQAAHRGLLKPGAAATKELIRTGNVNEALEEFMATGKWDKLRRFTIRYLSGFAGIPGGTQMNRVVDGLIAVSAGGMKDSAGKLMFPITDTKDKMRTFLAGPWASKGGQEYWDKRGKEIDLYIESVNDTPLLRDVAESLPIVSDLYKFGPDSPEVRKFNTFLARTERKTKKLKELKTQEEKAKYYQENKKWFRKVGEKPSGEKVYLPQALRTIDRKISKHRKQIRDIESGTVMVDKKPVKLTDKQKRLAISNLKRKIEGLAKEALKLRSAE